MPLKIILILRVPLKKINSKEVYENVKAFSPLKIAMQISCNFAKENGAQQQLQLKHLVKIFLLNPLRMRKFEMPILFSVCAESSSLRGRWAEFGA